jgi:hypothetical protein
VIHLLSVMLQADPGAPFIEQYGAIQPVPQHDGTECLKWDDSLWSHADHFKVCVFYRAVPSASPMYACLSVSYMYTCGIVCSHHPHAEG